jgi:hypothetical protein
MRKIALVLVFLSSLLPALQAKTRKDIPQAPLPEAVVTAHKVFVSNGGGSDLAFDAFYSQMKQWGKYQIVGSPNDAELIVGLSYQADDMGTRVWSSVNTYNHTTQVHSRQITGSGANMCEGRNKASGGVTTTRRVPHSKLQGQFGS